MTRWIASMLFGSPGMAGQVVKQLLRSLHGTETADCSRTSSRIAALIRSTLG